MNKANQSGVKRSFTIALLLLLFTIATARAEKVFEDNNPVGTYVITDYQNRKITLKINKPTSTAYLTTKGSGSITINGRTLRGTWSHFEDNDFFGFETYDNVRMVYSVPSGTVKTDQIIISQDGRASYNYVAIADQNDWIKVKRVGAPLKRASVTKPTTNAELTLSDFLGADMKMKNTATIFRGLQNKGFSMTKDENNSDCEMADFEKGNISINYYLDEMEGAMDCFHIRFPSVEAAKKFLAPLKNDKRWETATNYFGEPCSWDYRNVSISIINLPRIGIFSKRR